MEALSYFSRNIRKVTALLGIFILTTHSAFAAIAINNADFSDVSGMTNAGGGWYHGNPNSWSANGTNQYVIYNNVLNLDHVGTFTQNIGTVENGGEKITVSFEYGDKWNGGYYAANEDMITAELWDTTANTLLASLTVKNTGAFDSMNSASFSNSSPATVGNSLEIRFTGLEGTGVTPGNAAALDNVFVSTSDGVPPVITLIGSSPVSVEMGSVYTDDGATAADNLDGDKTANISTVSTVDTNVLGSYTVTYDVSDIAGNPATQVVRTVNVVDTTAPTISDINHSITFPPGTHISWTTNEASTTYVEYGPTDSYGSSTVLDPTLVTSHVATITGLSQTTTYHFRVVSVDSEGNTATSGDNVFTTSGATGGSVPSDAGVGSPTINTPVSNPTPTPTPENNPAPTPTPQPQPQTPPTPIPAPTPTENPTPENNPAPTPETPANPETNPEETPAPTPAPTPTPTPTPAPGGGTTGGTGGNLAPFNPADATLDIGGGVEPDATDDAVEEESFDPADATLDEGGGEPGQESSYTLLWILLGLLALLNTWWFFVAKNKQNIHRN